MNTLNITTMKKNVIPFSMAAALMMTACSVDDVISTEKDDSEKTPIEFSMTDNTGATVAVSGNTRAGFSSETGVVMRMVASNGAQTPSYRYTKTTAEASEQNSSTELSEITFSDKSTATTRYWDDAYGRNTKLSVYAVAVPGKSVSDNLKKLTGPNSGWSTEEKDAANTISWSVSTTQTKTTETNTTKEPIAEEDLVYSNNIQASGTDTPKGLENGVCKWDFTNSQYKTYNGKSDGKTNLVAGTMEFTLKDTQDVTGPGKFDKGNLNFTHALSRVTINVKLGTGFDSKNDNVIEAKLIAMPYTGTLDVQKGTFSYTGNYTSDITMDQRDAESGYKATYLGQVLPGYVINNNTDTKNVLSFKVGDNTYYVTQKSVYDALVTENNKDKLSLDEKTGNLTMAQGQNYKLNITVNKTGITNLTATLVGWSDISGSYERDNSYLKFSFSDYTNGSNVTAENFSLYRAAKTYTDAITSEEYTKDYTWNTGYSSNTNTAATLTYDNTTDSNNPVWKTNWYWDDNKTFYHLRTVGKDISSSPAAERDIKTEDSDDNKKDYFEIASGSTDGNYTWGAPFIIGDNSQNKTLTYAESDGFDAAASNDHHISHAIGATQSQIKLTQIHMLSHIKIKLATSTGDDAVTLYYSNGSTDGQKYAKVSIVGIYEKGKVYMGNGLVAVDGSRKTEAITMGYTAENGKTDGAYTLNGSYDYYVVPEALTGSSDGNTSYDVYFKIETLDGNVYYVKEALSKITASSVTNSGVTTPQTVNNAITTWYPGCCYTYTFTLKKTGITNLTATLVPYTTISGTNQDINLE